MRRETVGLAMGPMAMPSIVMRAPDVDLVADGDTLSWTGQLGATVQFHGSEIEQVHLRRWRQVHVHLRMPNGGLDYLTIRTPGRCSARRWVDAIEGVRLAGAKGLAPCPVGDASSGRVALTVEVDGVEQTREAELLIIACDPRTLSGVCDYTEREIELFARLQNYTFHTTLVRVKTGGVAAGFGVVFAPDPLDAMDGRLYGFRNETAKQFGREAASALEENLLVLYQLQGVRIRPWSKDDFLEALREQTQPGETAWWPYGADFEVIESLTTPYFNHFPSEALVEGSPWAWLGMQGERNTWFVHASTCFESALQCWSYLNLLMDRTPGARGALPVDKLAPIVILGAGVSGLLASIRLKRLGYSNVELLEVTERFGGKTRTVTVDGPAPPGDDSPTVCELGTCYLSPAYRPMVEDLRAYLEGNEQVDFTRGSSEFRGIVTSGEFPDDFDVPDVVDFEEYVFLKAQLAIRVGNDGKVDRLRAQGDLLLDLTTYSLLHAELMGLKGPMPTEPNRALQATFEDVTLLDFLEQHRLTSLVGLLQYGYQVQGYGVLGEIPLYYGLLWITPAITWALLLDQLRLRDEPGVTAWTQGWGDVWAQAVEKEALRITYRAKTTRIRRVSRSLV